MMKKCKHEWRQLLNSKGKPEFSVLGSLVKTKFFCVKCLKTRWEYV